MRRLRFIHFVAGSLTFLALVVSTNSVWSQTERKDWPAGVVPRGNLSEERSYGYDFSKISVQTLQTWLGRVGVDLPVELDGELSGWVWAQRSSKGWFDFRNYKIEGEIRSPKLKIDQWTVTDAGVRFGYAQSNWYVGKLSGDLRSPIDESLVGVTNASARILTSSSSNIEIEAAIDAVNLNALIKSLGLELNIANTGGSVSLKGTIPIATASDLKTWKATSEMKLNGVVLPWIEAPGKASATVKLTDGIWIIADGSIDVAKQDLKISGTGKLNSDLPFELAVKGRDIDATSLLRQLKLFELATQIAGLVQLDASVTGDQPSGIKRAEATVSADQLTVRSQPIERLAVRGQYTPTGFRVDIDSAELAGGVVSGSANWRDIGEIDRGFPSESSLQIRKLMLEELVWLDLPIRLAGEASGEFTFSTELRDHLDDWSSSGQLKVERLEAAGTSFGLTTFDWKKEFQAQELTGALNVQQGNGSLNSNLIAKLTDEPNSMMRATRLTEYQAKGQLQGYDLVARYGEDRKGAIPVQASGGFAVTGSPTNWVQRGNANLSNSLAMLDGRLLRLEMADLSFNESEIRIERFRLHDPTGRIAGSASVRRDNQGEHSLKLRIADVEIMPYVRRLVPEPMNSIGGTLSIELKLAVDAASSDISKDWEGRWDGSLTGLVFAGQTIGDLSLQGNLADRIVSADLAGTLMGGESTASLRLPLALLEDQTRSDSEPAKLQFRVEKAKLQRLAELVLNRASAKQFRGSTSMDLTMEGTSSDQFELTTKLDLPVVILERKELARDLTARLRFTGDKLLVERISGRIADGWIEAKGQLNLGREREFKLNDGQINFIAQRLDINKLVSIVSPEYAKYYAGQLDYRGTATFRNVVRLRGSASIKHGSLFGVPVQVARGAVLTELTYGGELRQLVSRDLHGTGIGGIFEAKLAIQGGKEYSLQTNGRVTRGKLEQLSRALGFQQVVGSGTFNGNFELNSNRIASLDALTGALQIDFENGDVQSIPIISSLERFVPLAQFASTDIETGRLNARIGLGQLRISDLIVTSKAFVFAASGSTSLDGSKLDLDSILQTGGGVQQRITQNVLDRLLVGTIAPVAAISQLNELIRNRSIFLHIGGSAARPVVQPKSGQTAAKAFLQNFGRSIVAATPLSSQ